MKQVESSMPPSVADMATLGKLLEKHRAQLLAMVQRRLDPALSPRLDPEDVLSETFLQAERKYARFKAQGGMTAYAWLYRLTLDSLIEVSRRNRRLPRDVRREVRMPERSSGQLELGVMHTGTGPSTAAARLEMQERVHRVVELLTEKDQDILWMRHKDQLSHHEIAHVLDISEEAAMVRYTRALKRFKDLWKKINPNE